MTTEILARDTAPVLVVDDGEPSPVLRTPVRWLCYWMEKWVIYLTVCVSSFPSRLVSSHEIAIGLITLSFQHSCTVKAMRHTPLLAPCMCLPLRINAGISRGLHRLRVILFIICLLHGPR